MKKISQKLYQKNGKIYRNSIGKTICVTAGKYSKISLECKERYNKIINNPAKILPPNPKIPPSIKNGNLIYEGVAPRSLRISISSVFFPVKTLYSYINYE